MQSHPVNLYPHYCPVKWVFGVSTFTSLNGKKFPPLSFFSAGFCYLRKDWNLMSYSVEKASCFIIVVIDNNSLGTLYESSLFSLLF